VRKLLPLLAAIAASIAVTVSPAGAVTGNFTPDNVHNYVGLVAFYDAQGNFLWRCTGSLLNSRTLLTAGHCTDVTGGAASAIVWVSEEGGAQFNPVTGAPDPLTGYPTACIPSSAYPCSTSNTLIEYGFNGLHKYGTDNADVGLVILKTPINLSHYASLAAAGSVDRLPTGTGVTITGYGVSGEKPTVVSYRQRLMAKAFIINTHNKAASGFNIQLSGNPCNGRGGSCFGDSGGPILYDSTNIVLGVNSFVKNLQCAGQSFAYRVDQAAVLTWIQQHAVGPVSIVSLP
jgi:Trypsin